MKTETRQNRIRFSSQMLWGSFGPLNVGILKGNIASMQSSYSCNSYKCPVEIINHNTSQYTGCVWYVLFQSFPNFFSPYQQFRVGHPLAQICWVTFRRNEKSFRFLTVSVLKWNGKYFWDITRLICKNYNYNIPVIYRDWRIKSRRKWRKNQKKEEWRKNTSKM